MNCHGAFTSEKEAHDKANEVYEQAVEDIGGEECYSEFKVWNDNNIITVEIHKVELKINENTKRDIAVNIIDSFEKVLQENDISVYHVIPLSFMYSDDIWNLVLTSKSNNSSKSNIIGIVLS